MNSHISNLFYSPVKSVSFSNSNNLIVQKNLGIKNDRIFSFTRNILKKKSIDAQLMDAEQLDNIQSTKPKLLVNSGFANDENDAMEKLREFAMQLSSSKVTEVSQSPDLHLIQAINTLDETDKIINSLSSRLREWYGLHFPELDNLIDSINGYSQIVLSGKRENISKENFEKAGFSKD